MFHRVQVADTSQHQLVRGDGGESGLHGRTAAKTPLQRENNRKGQERKGMDIRPVEISSFVWCGVDPKMIS